MKINNIKSDLVYLFINYFVAYIPCWIVRKFFYILFGMKIGHNSRIAMKCIVMSPSKIKIGENTIINEHCLLDGRGELELGNNNSISMFSKIYTCSHISNSNDFGVFCKKTIVKDNCWIGTSSITMPGSYIDDFTIVSVNSVFKGVSEKKGIYVGNPSKLVKTRKIEKKYKIDYKEWFR